MRSRMAFHVGLLAISSFLHAQEATPASSSQSSSLGCDSILKRAPPQVSGGRLLYRAIPKYPKAARKAKLQGTVRLESTLAKDGTIQNVKVLEGDPTLAAAAVEAVQRWRYEPYRLNDVPVEVSNAIVVNFTLDGHVEVKSDSSNPAPQAGGTANDATTEVANSGLPYPVYEHFRDINPPRALFAPAPTYTKHATKAKTQGNVILGIIVTPEGNVINPQVCKSLDAELDRNAVDTVSTWKFTPATKDGRPVAAHILVDVTFRLF
ncbi:MAG: energy transducer TonB [Terriglobales bacterium]